MEELPFSTILSMASLTKGSYSSFTTTAPTFINSSTELRRFTSFTKHFFTNSTKSLDHSDEESEGGSPSHTFFIT